MLKTFGIVSYFGLSFSMHTAMAIAFYMSRKRFLIFETSILDIHNTVYIIIILDIRNNYFGYLGKLNKCQFRLPYIHNYRTHGINTNGQSQ